MGIHPKVRGHHIIFFLGLLYIRMVAAFGASTTPAIFCCRVDATLDFLRWLFGDRLEGFNEMDDFLLIALDLELTKEEILEVFTRLGWVLHPNKCFDWCRIFLFAGIWWDLDALTMRIPEEKREKYLNAVKGVLAKARRNETFVLKDVQKIVGYLQYAMMTISSMRTELQPFYKFERDFAPNAYRPLHLTHPAFRSLERWERFFSTPDITGSFAIPPTNSPLVIYSDASDTGIGVVIDNYAASFVMEKDWRTKYGADIGGAEGWGVECALECALKLGAKDCRLRMWCDNQGFVGAFKKGWCADSTSNQVIRRINKLADAWGIFIELVWVATAENRADGPSRGEKGKFEKFPFEVPIPRGVVGGLPP